MRWIDWAAIWVFLFGVWPLAHPEHNFDTPMGAADIVLHLAAFSLLCLRWKVQIVRREIDR